MRHVVQTHSALISLSCRSLGSSYIGMEGAMHLAKLLTATGSLEILDLSENSILDVGVAHVAHALKTNTSLTTLLYGHVAYCPHPRRLCPHHLPLRGTIMLQHGQV